MSASMFAYYFDLALRSFRRNKALTALMILAIALGIGASMTTLTVFHVLSGGQQQRAAIARALAGTPRLLLADEPTGNLDSQMARGVLELLEEINGQGTTIVMVTHDPELAARAQRNVHIVDGMATDLSVEPSLRRVSASSLSQAQS